MIIGHIKQNTQSSCLLKTEQGLAFALLAVDQSVSERVVEFAFWGLELLLGQSHLL